MTNAVLLPTIDLDDYAKRDLARAGSAPFETSLHGGSNSSGYWVSGLCEDTQDGLLPHLSIEGHGTEYDDPVVVSDDDPAAKARNIRLQKMQAMHSHFALHPIIERGITESVIFQGYAKHRLAVDRYRVLVSNILGATGVGMLASPAYAAFPAMAALQFLGHTKNAAIMGNPETVYPTLLDASRQQSLMNSYRAILGPAFEYIGYSPTETYEDGIGGLIVDYLRAEARICVALADEQIQFIYKKEDAFTSQVFDQPETAKIAVLDFIQSEFV